MRTPVVLGLYGTGLAVVFAASFALGAVLIPADLSEAWIHQVEQATHPSGDHEQSEQQ